MDYDAALIKTSFQILHAREPHIPKRFYEVFFKLHPTVAPMFHGRAQQELMFAKTLVAIIDRIDDAPWLEEQLAEIGARHSKLPLRPEMWIWFQAALMATFEEIAGEDWTPETERAWNGALGYILRRVRAAAERGAA